MQALLNGYDVDAACLGVNDGLNFGRFDDVDGPIFRYTLRLTLEELAVRVEGLWNELVAEMHEDDQRDAELSALRRMNAQTFRGAFAFPGELREVIEAYLTVDILKAFVPFSESSRFVVNSADTMVVGPQGLEFSGRCFERR